MTTENPNTKLSTRLGDGPLVEVDLHKLKDAFHKAISQPPPPDALERANSREAKMSPARVSARRARLEKKFENLLGTTKDAILQSDPDVIRKRIASLREGIEYQKKLMETDDELAARQHAVSQQASIYREPIKELDLEIQFAITVLEDKGKA